MNKPNSASKIRLSSFDDLFGVNDVEGVREIMVNELYEFKNHPFKPVKKEKLDELVQSIKENGVLVPGIARIRPQGGYEIIAGHNRVEACKIAGISTIPMFIRNISDDEAVIAMVDSNIQREDILPSERAKAYKMKYEAIKHQGKKGDSLSIVGEATGENSKTIQRFIRLAALSDELLQLVDKKKIGFSQGISLSYLNPDDQALVLQWIQKSAKKLSMEEAGRIRELSQNGALTEEALDEIFATDHKRQLLRRVVFEDGRLKKYFPDNYTVTEIEDIIISLLDKWRSEAE